MKKENKMAIAEHLDELRRRIIWSVIALIIGSIVGMIFADQLIAILARPIGGLDNLIAIEITEGVSVFMRVSLLCGLVISLPFILYQLFAFILPGLEPNEKKWIFLILPIATILFIGGAVFAYFVMLPTALPFMISFIGGITTTPRLENYYKFVTNLIFWIGLSFELPLLMFLLAKIRIIKADMLLKGWRIAMVIIAVLAAVITPTPDPLNMGILMIPLFVLYLLSIIFVKIAYL